MSNLPPPGSNGTPQPPPPPPPWQSSLEPGPTPPKPSNTPKIVIGVIIVAVLAGGGVFLATRSDTKSATPTTQPIVSSPSTDGSIADTQASAASTPATQTTTPRSTAAPTTIAPTTNAPTTNAPTTIAPTTIAPTSSTTPTRATLAFPTITTSLPNASTVPSTVPPPTVASATTAPFVVPPNAIDLGHHVFISLPDGWTHTPNPGGQQTLVSADGNSKLGIQVLARSVGEAPSALMQEYADTFTPSLAAVNFTSTVRYTLSGPVPAYEYGSYYESYSSTTANGVGTMGALYVFQRADGLSTVYDVFGPTNVMGIGDAAFQTFTSSFEAAPLLGPSGNLQAFTSFRPTTTIPSVAVTSVLGFTPPPGFTTSTDPGGGSRVASPDYNFTVKELTAQPNADAVLQASQAALGTEYTGVAFGTQQPSDSFQGLTHVGVSWNGTFTDGKAVSGGIDTFWDPKTMNAISITRAWYTTADGTEPESTQSEFMYRAVTDDISFGIPNP